MHIRQVRPKIEPSRIDSSFTLSTPSLLISHSLCTYSNFSFQSRPCRRQTKAGLGGKLKLSKGQERDACSWPWSSNQLPFEWHFCNFPTPLPWFRAGNIRMGWEMSLTTSHLWYLPGSKHEKDDEPKLPSFFLFDLSFFFGSDSSTAVKAHHLSCFFKDDCCRRNWLRNKVAKVLYVMAPYLSKVHLWFMSYCLWSWWSV